MSVYRLCLLAVASLVLPTTGCASAAKRPVLERVDSYYADFSDRDWDAFRTNFWEDATLSTVWRPAGEPADRVVITDVEAFIEQAPEGPGSRPIFEERRTGAFVILEKDLAHVWASYEAKFGDEDDLMEWSGIDAITLLRHDGEWRIVSIVYAQD